jgi:hypothetical protein
VLIVVVEDGAVGKESAKVERAMAAAIEPAIIAIQILLFATMIMRGLSNS